ncbi:MAG: hypothetical protein JWP14_3385 [Frankiales bacterium]|nr:hypothetical protein [Frankiales bacterium]
MSDINVRTTAYQVEKRSWLLSEHGTEPGTTPSVVLDVSTFTAATHFPNGYLVSGIALGVITASSTGEKVVVGPYDDTASDGRQVFYGYLFSAVKVPNVLDLTKDCTGAALVHGFVSTSKLPIANAATGGGFIDANGKADNKLIHYAA